MFASHTDVIGLSDPALHGNGPIGESHDDDYVYMLTCAEAAAESLDADRQILPPGLEDAEPSLFTAMVVSAVDRTMLNGHDAVRLMQTEARLSSHYEAAKLATMVEVARSPTGDIDSGVKRDVEAIEYAADEIAAALTLTRRAAHTQLDLALSLKDRLADVWSKFSSGLVDVAKIRVLDDQLGHLPAETVATVTAQILEGAPEMTTGQLRARLARLVMKADPQGEAVQYQAGIEDRKIVIYANPDHTANIHASNLEPGRVTAAMTRINQQAQGLRNSDETRTLDQLRADVFLDLLEGNHPSRAKTAGGGVHLHVDLTTLSELSDAPGELAGYGPVIADIARKTAAAQAKTTWDYTVTDNGAVVTNGTTRYRPSAATKRSVSANYPTCVHPGCRMPVHNCDIDHRHPWVEGGPTHHNNLEPLCRHHHMLKHHSAWRLQRQPNGDHKWTSPLGHSYTTQQRAPPH